MFVISRKRISLILVCLLLAIFAYSYEGTKINLEQETVQVTSTPVSGKIIVVDAGHGIPDEGVFLLHKENKQLTFYK